MTDWNKVAPTRFENAKKQLDLIAKTAGRNYDVPTDQALKELADLEAAYLMARAAYRAAGCPIEDAPVPRRDTPSVQDRPSDALVLTWVHNLPELTRAKLVMGLTEGLYGDKLEGIE